MIHPTPVKGEMPDGWVMGHDTILCVMESGMAVFWRWEVGNVSWVGGGEAARVGGGGGGKFVGSW